MKDIFLDRLLRTKYIKVNRPQNGQEIAANGAHRLIKTAQQKLDVKKGKNDKLRLPQEFTR